MFGKHFASTYTGSMYGAGPVVFAVWGYVIANAVKGRVELNPTALAHIIGTTSDEIERAIAYLEAPDARSRSVEHEGRRLIREGAFQFQVPTHDKYRAIRNEDDRREQNRQAKQRQRLRESPQDTADDRTSPQMTALHRVSPQMSSLSAQAEAEAETETELPPTPSLRSGVGAASAARTSGESPKSPQEALSLLDPSPPLPPSPKRAQKPSSRKGGASPPPSWVAHIVEGISKLGEPIRGGANPYGRVGAAFKERVAAFGPDEVRAAFDRFAAARLQQLQSDRPVRTGFALEDFDRDFAKYLPLSLLGSTNRASPASDPPPTLPSPPERGGSPG